MRFRYRVISFFGIVLTVLIPLPSLFTPCYTLLGVSSGILTGFAGLMILGFLVDGADYRKPALLILMAALGGLWIVFYPSGWLLGIPLIVYPLLRRFGFGARPTQKEDL